MLPLLRGHSKSLGAFAQGLSSGVKKTIAFLTSKHKETKYEPAPLLQSQSLLQGDGGSSSPKDNLGHTFGTKTGRRKRERERPKGPYWTLSRNTCAICHHRLRDTLDAQLGLPAIQPAGEGSLTGIGRLTGETIDPEDQERHDDGDDNEETRIHIPAQTDCEEECRYCFYCISEALTMRAKQAQTAQEERGRRKGRQDKQIVEKDGSGVSAVVKGWDCLRCGGEVWSCMRLAT
jgi:hypothetical protein